MEVLAFLTAIIGVCIGIYFLFGLFSIIKLHYKMVMELDIDITKHLSWDSKLGAGIAVFAIIFMMVMFALLILT